VNTQILGGAIMMIIMRPWVLLIVKMTNVWENHIKNWKSNKKMLMMWHHYMGDLLRWQPRICSKMLDEVDILHVKRNNFSGDEFFSYIGFQRKNKILILMYNKTSFIVFLAPQKLYNTPSTNTIAP
jgi:hypothetical protein